MSEVTSQLTIVIIHNLNDCFVCLRKDSIQGIPEENFQFLIAFLDWILVDVEIP